jgi:hypothetical protein
MKSMTDFRVLAGISESASAQDMTDFAKARFDGAEKITNNAKEKGGFALLTYEHFKVKLPYYKKAKQKFDMASAKKEYAALCTELHSHMNNIEKMDMKKFQQHLGKMEVLGELLIQHADS